MPQYQFSFRHHIEGTASGDESARSDCVYNKEFDDIFMRS